MGCSTNYCGCDQGFCEEKHDQWVRDHYLIFCRLHRRLTIKDNYFLVLYWILLDSTILLHLHIIFISFFLYLWITQFYDNVCTLKAVLYIYLNFQIVGSITLVISSLQNYFHQYYFTRSSNLIHKIIVSRARIKYLSLFIYQDYFLDRLL